jgi:hypothetical protein
MTTVYSTPSSQRVAVTFMISASFNAISNLKIVKYSWAAVEHNGCTVLRH